MACDIISGIKKSCKASLGGNSAVYLFNFVPDAFTVSAGTATGISTGITQVYSYEITGDGSTLQEVLTSSRETGTSTNLQTLVMVLKGISIAAGNTLNTLAYGTTNAVVKDRNGIYHCLGLLDGFDFTVDQVTGGVKTDLNGYTVTGIATTGALSPKMDASTIAAFLALVQPNP